MRERPNILFIMTDHQRADSIGMTQAGMEICPNLNGLAAEGVNFTRAYNTCPLCVPARTALATGKYPSRNGVIFNDWRGVRAGDHKPIHQFLSEAGYSVGHIGVDHIRVKPTLQERVPFSRSLSENRLLSKAELVSKPGFRIGSRWIDNGDYSRYLKDLGIDETPAEGRDAFRKEIVEFQDGEFVKVKYSNTRTAVWDSLAEHFKDSYFCQQGVDFINQENNEPFALFVYLWAPHPPLRVPEPYASMFGPENIDLPANVNLPAQGEPPGRRRGIAAQLAENVSMDEWRKVWAAHLGLVNLADAGIGGILNALENSGQADNTIVVFSVDHGDHLGQHRMYQKMEMYEQAINIPLIIRVPGGHVGVFDNPVSHLDLMPTLLDMVGIEKPDNLDGISLKESIVSGDSPPDRLVFSQYCGNPAMGDIRQAAIGKRYKYIYDPVDTPELYDLQEDPLETRNLAADGEYRRLMSELREECRRYHSGISWCAGN